MTDGRIYRRTKDGVSQAAARPVLSGGGAVVHTTRLVSTTPDTFETFEVISFTLAETATLYINGHFSAGESTSNGYQWLGWQVHIYSTHPDFASGHFSLERQRFNRDQFDTVTLPAGDYTLYASISGEWDELYLNTQIIVGTDNDNTTMTVFT